MADVPEDETSPTPPGGATVPPVPAAAGAADRGQARLDTEEALRIQREAELKIERAERLAQASRRLKTFFNHLLIGVVIMVILVVGNLLVLPNQPWFIIPLVIWGLAISLHAAYAVGLFGNKG